jgi:hypothetical protein
VRYLHEVWEDPENGSVTFHCAAWPWADLNRRRFSPLARVIGTFDAGSMVEAKVRFNHFMGWNDYKPSAYDDDEPYPDDWGAEEVR